MGLKLKRLKMSPALFAWCFTESVADQTDQFANGFDRENVAYGYDVVKMFWRSKVYSRRHFVSRNQV